MMPGSCLLRNSPPPGAGLSVVVPLYNGAAVLPQLHDRLVSIAQNLQASRAIACEVVYVDDGSSDAPSPSLATYWRLGSTFKWSPCRVISARRRRAGLDHSRLGAVLFMEGDGQHPPALIETMVCHSKTMIAMSLYTAKASRTNESLVRRAAPRSSAMSIG